MISPRFEVALLHHEIEEALAHRFVGALSPRANVEPGRAATGIDAVDASLGGGLPIGCVSEFVGVESSGRTTLALSFLVKVTAQDAAAAWVDASDAFDPESAARSGVDLRRLLWVRCADSPAAPVRDEKRSALSGCDCAPSQKRPSQASPKGGGSPHPRSEAHGMQEAVASLLQAQSRPTAIPDRCERRMVGTPGAPNRVLTPFSGASPYREEQIPTDRMPARRSMAEAESRLAGKSIAKRDNHVGPYRLSIPAQASRFDLSREPSCGAVERALRVTDLLLQAGGFSLLVLDLGSVPPEMIWRVPLSTWYRFRSACERTRTTLVLLTQHPCAKASAETVVRMSPDEMEAQSGVLTGIRYILEVERERSLQAFRNVVPTRKPPRAERYGRWQGQAAWAVQA